MKQTPRWPLIARALFALLLHLGGLFLLVMMAGSFALILSILCFLPLASLVHIKPRDFDAPFLDCYDYIIVGASHPMRMCKGTNVLQAGGGVSGLVVANRLTEDPNGKPIILIRKNNY